MASRFILLLFFFLPDFIVERGMIIITFVHGEITDEGKMQAFGVVTVVVVGGRDTRPK